MHKEKKIILGKISRVFFLKKDFFYLIFEAIMELINSGKKMSKLFWINFWGYSYRISLFNMSIAHSDYVVMDHDGPSFQTSNDDKNTIFQRLSQGRYITKSVIHGMRSSSFWNTNTREEKHQYLIMRSATSKANKVLWGHKLALLQCIVLIFGYFKT